MTTDTKELVIEAHIPLPDDYFEESQVAANAKNATEEFRAALTATFGEDNFRLFVTRKLPPPPKKTRAPRADAGRPRGPRGATANGPVEQQAGF